jgi:hypothetical protein
VVTFAMLGEGGKLNSDWYRMISFPLFIFNSLQVLGNARDSVGDEVHLPGQPVTLRADTLKDQITVTLPPGATTPAGKTSETITRTPQGMFIANHTDRTGIYHARWDPDGLLPFAVNQFDFRESNLAPRGLVPEGVPEAQADDYKIKIGYNPVAGIRQTRPGRQDWWKPIALVVLGVLLLEWYIYNRRVYI